MPDRLLQEDYRPVILMVDDEKSAIEFGREVFKTNYRFTGCANMIEAQKVLAAGLKPDCVILDLYLPCPGMQGINTFDAMQRLLPGGTPIVVFTSYEDAIELCGKGTGGALLKGRVSMDALHRKVLEAMLAPVVRRQFMDDRNRVSDLGLTVASMERRLDEIVKTSTESWNQKVARDNARDTQPVSVAITLPKK